VNNAGCMATFTSLVNIGQGPVAAFTVSSPDCSGSAVVFSDQSTINTGSISKWNWSFGDGTVTTYTSAQSNVNHVYSQAGSYMVKLTVTSSKGCENTYQKIIVVTPVPSASYTWLNSCEGTVTQFTDQSINSGGITITPESGILIIQPVA